MIKFYVYSLCLSIFLSLSGCITVSESKQSDKTPLTVEEKLCVTVEEEVGKFTEYITVNDGKNSKYEPTILKCKKMGLSPIGYGLISITEKQNENKISETDLIMYFHFDRNGWEFAHMVVVFESTGLREPKNNNKELEL